MSAPEAMDWPKANQRYLMAAVALVRSALERHARKSKENANESECDQARLSHRLAMCLDYDRNRELLGGARASAAIPTRSEIVAIRAIKIRAAPPD